MEAILYLTPMMRDTKLVQVILQGACSGCPSSTFTLKNGIEQLLRDMLAWQRLNR